MHSAVGLCTPEIHIWCVTFNFSFLEVLQRLVVDSQLQVLLRHGYHRLPHILMVVDVRHIYGNVFARLCILVVHGRLQVSLQLSPIQRLEMMFLDSLP
jgi:hypothetical protein